MKSALVFVLFVAALASASPLVAEVQPCFFDSVSTSNYYYDCQGANVMPNYRPGGLSGYNANLNVSFSATFTYNVNSLACGTSYTLALNSLLAMTGDRAVTVTFNGATLRTYVATGIVPYSAFGSWTVTSAACPSTSNTVTLTDSSASGVNGYYSNNLWRVYFTA